MTEGGGISLRDVTPGTAALPGFGAAQGDYYHSTVDDQLAKAGEEADTHELASAVSFAGQGSSQQQAARAVPMLISANYVLRACIALIALCPCCLADEVSTPRFLSDPSDHSSSSGLSETNILDLEKTSWGLANAITEKLENGAVRVRRWNSQKIIYAITGPDLNAWAPMSSDATRDFIRTQLNEFGNAGGIAFSENVASKEVHASLRIRVEPLIPSLSREPSNSIIERLPDCQPIEGGYEKEPCKISSSIEDTKVLLKIENGAIAGSECAIGFDPVELCRGQTLLTALSEGKSSTEVCESWASWRRIFRPDINYADEHDESLPHRLDGCTWSRRHFQSMSNKADNWRPYWRRQLSLCVVQSFGFLFDDNEPLEPPALTMPQVRIGVCSLSSICRSKKDVVAGAENRTTDCTESPVSMFGVHSTIGVAYDADLKSPSTTQEVAERIRKALQAENNQKRK